MILSSQLDLEATDRSKHQPQQSQEAVLAAMSRLPEVMVQLMVCIKVLVYKLFSNSR